MGYEINSIWTQIHEKDIKKLNEIIDDEYRKELEIGRKLNIMKKFNKAFDDAINDIYWDNILEYMKKNNWEWAFYDNGENYRIPTKQEMIERLRKEYLNYGLYEILELGKKEFSLFGGGFNFKMRYSGDDYFVFIYFDIAHFVK